MSTPIVENGQLQEFCVVGLKSGSKDMSNGRRFGSDGHKLVRSVCSLCLVICTRLEIVLVVVLTPSCHGGSCVVQFCCVCSM